MTTAPMDPLRLPRVAVEEIDDWIRQQGEPPSRSEAIRMLIEQGLKTRKGEGELNGLSVAIGALQAEVSILADVVKEGRAAVGELSESVLLLERSVTDMRPHVEDYRIRSERAKGAAEWRKWMWAGLAALISTSVTLGAKIQQLWVKPPLG